MSLVYDFKRFEKTIGLHITIKRTLIFKSGDSVEEYVQGVLRKVDYDNDAIDIEQYLTFLDYINGDKTTPSKVVKFKNKEFELVSRLQG